MVGAFVVGALFVAAFLGWERRARYPMLPLAYFRSRGFATANGVIFFQFVSLIGSLFMITQFFQIGLGYTPLQAGVRILVWMAMPMLVAPIAGLLAARFGNKPLMLLGMILQGSGLGWLAAAVEPVADFIRGNVSPYAGDGGFPAGPAPRTTALSTGRRCWSRSDPRV